MGVNEVLAVKTPDRHLRPLEHASEKCRERLAQKESQRNRDLLQSVRVENSFSRCELEPGEACLVCEQVVAEGDWQEGDEDIPICKRCDNTNLSDYDPSFLQTLLDKVSARQESH